MSNGTNYAKDSQMTRRYIMLLIGIFFMGTGISLIIKSGTGTSPMSSLTNVMTQICPLLTLGMYTFLLNVLFFIGEFIVDFKSFSASKFIQLIPTFFLSVAVDFNMFLVRGLHPETYILKLAVLIIGCMFFGLSIAFMVSADVILMPGEALIKIISVKYQGIWQCKDRSGCFAGGAGSHCISHFPEHHLRRQGRHIDCGVYNRQFLQIFQRLYQ